MPPDPHGVGIIQVIVGGAVEHHRRDSDGSVTVTARAAEEIIRRGGTFVE